ncbi:PH domain-containing protein [Thalassotalea sp. PLHSN55]|uniref:PH domain-containing protein n=1 Tax=Thalassotalea sp. PLHSN55 TaxID=3435888 RepID=UPI003F8484F1
MDTQENSRQVEATNTEADANFSNQAVSTQQLVGLSRLNYQPITASYLKTSRLVSLASTMILLAILMIVQKQPFFPLPAHLYNALSIAIFAFFAIGLAHYVYVALAYKKKAFALREQDISYRSGLIFQKIVTQPILRIQHVELKRGPIERKVGLASLQVFSAGGVSHTFEIPGLLLDSAESMRQFILDHKTMNNQ